MPMQPSPMAETSKLLFPSLRFCIVSPLTRMIPATEDFLTIATSRCLHSKYHPGALWVGAPMDEVPASSYEVLQMEGRCPRVAPRFPLTPPSSPFNVISVGFLARASCLSAFLRYH